MPSDTLRSLMFLLNIYSKKENQIFGGKPGEKQVSDDDAHKLYFQEIMTKFVHRNILTALNITVINKTYVVS